MSLRDIRTRAIRFGDTGRRLRLFRYRPTALVSASSLLLIVILTAGARTCPANDSSLLPFEGSDQVSVYEPSTGRHTKIAGVIEDIEGSVVLIRRRGNGRISAVPLTHVDELQFSRSDDYSRALKLFERSEFEEAFAACDKAHAEESRAWVRDEIQATAVRCCLALNRRDEALLRVERICERDSATRHLGLLPLVWDAQLPPEERYLAPKDDLRSPSPPRRLAAAASLLHEDRYSDDCQKILAELRGERRHPVSMLAEIQQWRMIMRDDRAIANKDLTLWKLRTAEMPPWIRPGAQYVLGRAFQLQHKVDAAAIEFLWTPFMRPDDPVLSASSLAEAASCLQQSGQTAIALQLRTELVNRFPQTSSARHHKIPVSSPKTE